MNTWLSNALNRAETVDDWLQSKRRGSLEQLRNTQWPTRKTEAWRYTSLRALERTGFRPGAATSAIADNIPGLNSIDVIFIDGILQNTPDTLPAGLSIVPLEKATIEQQLWALQAFANIKPANHLFGLINDVLATAGVLIDVAEDTHIERPIRIVHMMKIGRAHV